MSNLSPSTPPPTAAPLPAIIGTTKPFPWLTLLFIIVIILILIASFFFFLQAERLQGQLRISPTP